MTSAKKWMLIFVTNVCGDNEFENQSMIAMMMLILMTMSMVKI